MLKRRDHVVGTLIIALYLFVLSIIDKNLFSFYAVPFVISLVYFAYKLNLFIDSPIGKPLSFIILKALVIFILGTTLGVLTVRVFYW